MMSHSCDTPPPSSTPVANAHGNELFMALGRLDEVLALAIRQGRCADNAETEADFFRGLQIRAADVERILAGEPGVPWFRPKGADACDPTPVLGEDVPRLAWLAKTFGLSDFDLNVLMV